jgi:uncharacterized protein (TIGR04255 family)
MSFVWDAEMTEPPSTTQRYTRPPVVEAVIDVRFSPKLPSTDIERFMALARGRYPKQEHTHHVNIDVGGPPFSVTARANMNGARLSTDNESSLIILRDNGVAYAHVGPYPGWEKIYENFLEAFALFEKVQRSRRLTRIATRFINRIDIPFSPEKNSINLADYLIVGATMPSFLHNGLSSFFVRLGFSLGNGVDANVIVNSADEVLIDMASVVLDLDVFYTGDIVNSRKFLEEKLGEIRDLKNNIFESVITDRTRELLAK